MSSVRFREEDESWVDAVDAERLDESRHRQQVGERRGQSRRPAARVDEGAPRRHQLHDLNKERILILLYH